MAGAVPCSLFMLHAHIVTQHRKAISGRHSQDMSSFKANATCVFAYCVTVLPVKWISLLLLHVGCTMAVSKDTLPEKGSRGFGAVSVGSQYPHKCEVGQQMKWHLLGMKGGCGA